MERGRSSSRTERLSSFSARVHARVNRRISTSPHPFQKNTAMPGLRDAAGIPRPCAARCRRILRAEHSGQNGPGWARMPPDFTGTPVLVTGATMGLGAASPRAFLECGRCADQSPGSKRTSPRRPPPGPRRDRPPGDRHYVESSRSRRFAGLAGRGSRGSSTSSSTTRGWNSSPPSKTLRRGGRPHLPPQSSKASNVIGTFAVTARSCRNSSTGRGW